MNRPVDCRDWGAVIIVFSSLVNRVRFPCTGLQSAEIEVLLQLNVSTYNPLHNETSLNFRRNKICLKRKCGYKLKSTFHIHLIDQPIQTPDVKFILRNFTANIPLPGSECALSTSLILQAQQTPRNVHRLHRSYCRQSRHPAQLRKGL
jgi:hypothetical protein